MADQPITITVTTVERCEWEAESKTWKVVDNTATTSSLSEEDWAEVGDWCHRVELIGCRGVGGRMRQVATDMDLGRGWHRARGCGPGLRRAVWDIAFGYVSGFRIRDIAYWVLTQSLCPSRFHRPIHPASPPSNGHHAA